MIAEIATLAGQFAAAGEGFTKSRDYLLRAAGHCLESGSCTVSSRAVLYRAALGCAIIHAPAHYRQSAKQAIDPLIAQCEAVASQEFH